MKNRQRKVAMRTGSLKTGNRVLVNNAYLLEFASSTAGNDHFQTVIDSLSKTHQIHHSKIHKRCQIQTELFTGVSFTVTVDHPIEAIEMIEDVINIHPIYTVRAPKPFKIFSPSSTPTDSNADPINSYGLTGVTDVHKKLNNYGKGVRVRKLQNSNTGGKKCI
jgi:hypothetical protein